LSVPRGKSNEFTAEVSSGRKTQSWKNRLE
jgi:hypothetical protein